MNITAPVQQSIRPETVIGCQSNDKHGTKLYFKVPQSGAKMKYFEASENVWDAPQHEITCKVNFFEAYLKKFRMRFKILKERP